MKNIFLIFSIFLFTNLSICQQTEFVIYPNGLIYDEDAIEKLGYIVDSLNLEFRSSNLERNYYSNYQGKGKYFEITKGDFKSIISDLNTNPIIDELKKKYKVTIVKNNILIVRFENRDYLGYNIVQFSEINAYNTSGTSLSFLKKNFPEHHEPDKRYIFKIAKSQEGKETKIQAFYFPHGIKRIKLETKYAQMIGYSNCLIDTTLLVTKEDLSFIPNLSWEEHLELHHSIIDLPKNFKKLTLVAKKALLMKMKNQQVYGLCGQDITPKIHAMNIALLSAETANWKVFLKSHLNIMNDCFNRVSVGNYAFENRKTCVKEIEDIGINVHDLILGISFRICEYSIDYYSQHMSKIGHVIFESEEIIEFENSILDIIENENLDDFNRILGFYIFRNYLNCIQDEASKMEKNVILSNSLKNFPHYLKNQINKK